MNRRRSSWLTILLFAAAAYATAALVARGVSDSMLFHPKVASRTEPPGAFRLAIGDGASVSAVYLEAPDARFTLWYFHGNAESLSDVWPRLQHFQRLGFSVFAVEYPGYGVSGGRATEPGIYAASRAGLTYLEQQRQVPRSGVILYGRSLGGGPAVELATHNGMAGLVVESAFTSAFRVLTRWPLLPGDKFKNERKLARVDCPVLVIHGRSDEVVPFHHGEALYAAARGPKRALWIDGAGHNDLTYRAGGRLDEALREFARDLAVRAGAAER